MMKPFGEAGSVVLDRKKAQVLLASWSCNFRPVLYKGVVMGMRR